MRHVSKYGALSDADFGNGTAELEKMLGATFVETPLWEDLLYGKKDVVYGAKGSGKSAMYSHLFDNYDRLRGKGVILVGAENVRDDPVFQNLPDSLGIREDLFVGLWKLYFLALIGRQMRLMSLRDSNAQSVINSLEQEGLLLAEEQSWLSKAFKAVQRYATVEFAGQLGLPLPFPAQLTGKITLHEPSQEQVEREGKVSVHHLFQLTAKALERAKNTIWLVVDRLDVAFVSNPELEARALRALFQTYSDLSIPAYKQAINVKIFLRSDIWDRISGKRTGDSIRIANATAIVGALIKWNDAALMSLVMRRVLANESLRRLYKVRQWLGVRRTRVWSSYEKQQDFFYRVFPPYMKVIREQPGRDPVFVRTFDWMLNQTRDGTGQVAPRNLILLLNYARDIQRERMNRGAARLDGEVLFEEAALDEAAMMVSEFHLFQTLFNEYPDVRPHVEMLRGRECEYSLPSLAEAWGVGLMEAQRRVDELIYLGFFEQRHTGGAVTYYVPALFQHALAIIPESVNERQ